MARTLPLVALGLVLWACGSIPSEGDAEEALGEPPAFLREEIEQRIAALPFQSEEQLIRNMKRLAYIGEAAVPQLLEALKHEHPRTRGSAAWILGVIRDRRTIVPLRELLDDPVAAVRYEAATSICIMGDPRGYSVLVDGLSDSDIRNRYKAHEALRLLTRLDFGYRHDDEPSRRRAAVEQWEEWLEGMEETNL